MTEKAHETARAQATSQMGKVNSSVKSNLITMLNRRERVTRRRKQRHKQHCPLIHCRTLPSSAILLSTNEGVNEADLPAVVGRWLARYRRLDRRITGESVIFPEVS
jgi:hypothetical protein